jgi:acyl carrier protein
MPDHETKPLPEFDPTVLADYPPAIGQAAAVFAKSKTKENFLTTLHALLRFHQLKSAEGPAPLDPATAPKETALLDGLGLDSLGFAELSFLLDDLWGITIENEEFSTLVTLQDLESFLITRLGITS